MDTFVLTVVSSKEPEAVSLKVLEVIRVSWMLAALVRAMFMPVALPETLTGLLA